jgi:initiation factor 1A
MPKNLKGGNKAKSLKNSSGIDRKRTVEVPEDSDDSHIAIIMKVYGDSRYMVQIINNNGLQSKQILAHISKGTKNKYAKGIILGLGSYVLISIRDFEKDKADIIFAYKDTEISYLIQNDYIVKLNMSNIDNVVTNDDINNDNIAINDDLFDISEI